MADVNAEIGVSINTSGALAQLKALQREIARFHTSVAKTSENAALAQRDLQKNFINGINSIQGFSAELRTVRTTAESFTDSLEKNKLSMREYFRYSAASTKTFGRFFRTELDTVNKVALENVKRLQTQYIKMGRDATGAMRAIAIMPTKLDLTDLTTQTQIAAQKQALFNQLVKQGSTNLLNFGKNTQWAGRQLMVGFTLPLVGLGSAASKTFMDMETAAIKFRKVYGDLFTPVEEREQAFADIQELGRQFTKYGIAVAETITLAAEAAAAGFQGIDLQRQVTEATRLQVLGQVEQQKALETTISLQNAFRMSSEDLADAINFLNAVENQTVVSLDDITTAIPKAAPIVQELGGDVKDLAFFMAAMKEGGINASEGANALKSGLASLINPTGKAKEMLEGFGIDIDSIVEKNVGNVKQTVIDFALALDDLSSLSRQRAIEQLFGKFQQARLSALFSNVIRDGNQASRVLDLAGASVEELATLSENELGITANSAMNKFRAAVEQLKSSLAPVGQIFLEVLTPFIENIGQLFDKFNSLSAGTKKTITALVIGIGAIAPVVLMTVGLFANFVANGIKGLMLLRNGYLRLTGQSQILSEQTNYLTVEQQQALAAAASLEQSHMKLQQVFTGEAQAIRQLVAEYQRMIAAQNTAVARFPAMMSPGFKPNGYKDGKPIVVGGTGNKDTELALLAPGETVIPADMSKKFAPLINSMIADNIPGYIKGKRFQFFTRERREQIAEQFGLAENERLRLPLTEGGYAYSVAGMMAPREVNRPTGPRTAGTAAGMTQEFLQSPTGRASFMANVQVGLEDLGINAQELSRILDLVGPTLQQAIDEFDGSTESWVAAANNATQTISELDQLTEQQKEIIRQRVAPIDPDDYLVPGFPMVEVSREKARSRSERATGAYRADRQLEILREQGFDTSEFEYSHMPGFEKIAAETSAITAPSIAGRTLTEQQVQEAQEIARAYDIARAEHRKKLEELRLEIDKAEGPIREAGRRVGEAAIAGVAEGTNAASPSKDAIQQGRNVSDGFEQGILEGQDDAAIAGSKVKDAAVAGFQQETIQFGVPLGKGPLTYEQESIPLDLNAKPAPIPVQEEATDALEEFQSVTIQAQEIQKQSTANLQKWNSRLMSGSFALSTITGGLSMFGKDLGGIGNILFKVSSALFVFQGIVQALTQAKLLELAATRLAVAKQASAFATYGTGMASRAGMAGLIGRIGVFTKTLLGLTNPVGLIATGLTVAGAAFFVFNKRAEANRKKIDGLGEAASATGKKIEGLADYFAVDEKKFAFETYDFSRAGGPLLAPDKRSEVQKAIESDMFKNFQNDIEAIRNATAKEATLALESLALGLEAKGFSREQVDVIVKAILQEAGRRDVVIDFASIDISSKEGKEAFEKRLSSTFNIFNKRLAKGVNDSFKKSLGLTSNTIANALGALELKFSSGAIGATEYAAQVKNINTQILAIRDSAQQANLIDAIFKSMGEEAQEAASGISNVADKLLVMQAILFGIDDALIDGLKSTDLLLQDISRRGINDALAEAFKVVQQNVEDLNKANEDGVSSGEKGLTLNEKLIKIYEKERQKLEKKAKALADVNEQISRQNEFIQDQMDLTNQITEAKISGNYLEAAALTQQKLMKQVEFRQESKEIELQRQIDKINDRISELEDDTKKVVLTNAEKRMLNIYADMFKRSGTKSGGGGGKVPGPTQTTTKKKTPETIGQADLGIPTASVAKNNENAPAAGAAKNNRGIPDPTKVFNDTVQTKGYSWTVAFDTKSGKWIPVRRGTSPSGTISFNEWRSGKVRTYSDGGKISGPGTSTSDSIPILASDGEFMFSAKAVKNAGGANAVAAMHEYFKNAQGLKGGGPVSKYFSGIAKQNKKYKGFGSGLLNAGPSASLARIFGGMRRSGDILNVLGSLSGIPLGRAAQTGSLAKSLYAIPNKVYQLINSLKVRSMIKSKLWHGSQPTGSRGEEFLQGTNVLDGTLGKDPFYKMGFFGTTSKAEADLYAGGYNSFSNWGEAFGSLNLITKAPRGKYVDFTKGPKSLKWQDYTLSQALGKDFMPSNLGDIMRAQGVVGGIMNRVNSGFVPKDIASAKWLAWANPKGVNVEEYLGKFAKGGLVNMASLPKFESGISNVPYDMPAILHQGERVLTKGENQNYNSRNVTITAEFNITGDNPRDIANQVMIQLERLSNKNNKSNRVIA